MSKKNKLKKDLILEVAQLQERIKELETISRNQQQAQDIFQENEYQFRSVFTNASIGIDIVDAEGRPILANLALQEMLGYSEEELRSMVFADYTHPDDIEDSLRLVQDVREGKQDNFSMEKRYIRKDGAVIWGKTSVSGIRDAQGNFQYFIAMVEDITERKRAEQELKESEQNFRDLVESLMDGLVIIDENGNYLFVNKMFSKITGYSEAELLKMTIWDMTRPEDQAKLKNKMKDRMQGKPVEVVYERIIVREDGTELPLEMSTKIIFWQGEKSPLAIIRDISERKQAEQDKDYLLHQVLEANERLKSLSRDLINSQEDERKRISQELHDELGQALTVISLDLGIIEQNLHPETPPEIRERLSDTKKNANDLDQMIRELALDLRPSLLDDLGLLPTLKWYAYRFSQRAEIEVVVEVSGEEKRLPGEVETVLYRIIQEALTNVAKHAKAKKVDLQIDKRAGAVLAIIKDDGRGFDIDILQFPETSLRGLGLIGMADRTALVGGDFRIYSKPGEGTRIEVEIPL